MSKLKTQINFDEPNEDQVLDALFRYRKPTDAVGFRDVFSDAEIDRMMSSDEVWSVWSQSTRDWIVSAFDEILSSGLERK